MKVYLWDSVSALAQFSSGYAIAHAESKEDAIRLIVQHRKKTGFMSPKELSELETEIRGKEPKCFEGKMAYTIHGSA